MQVFQHKKKNKLKQLFLLLLVGLLTFFSTYGLIQFFTIKIYASASDLVYMADYTINYPSVYNFESFDTVLSVEPYLDNISSYTRVGKTFTLNNARSNLLFGGSSSSYNQNAFFNRNLNNYFDFKFDYIGEGSEPTYNTVRSMFGLGTNRGQFFANFTSNTAPDMFFDAPFVNTNYTYLSETNVLRFRPLEPMYENFNQYNSLDVGIYFEIRSSSPHYENFLTFINDNYEINVYIVPLSDFYSIIVNTGYSIGYDLGYNQGYLDSLDAGELEIYNQGFSQGFLDGQTDGYADGFADGEIVGYNQGFIDGLDEGQLEGYNLGYDEGWNIGRNEGYAEGIGDSEGGVKGLLLVPASILGTLFSTAFNWLNFTVLGINLWSLILIAASFSFVVLILKMFFGR